MTGRCYRTTGDTQTAADTAEGFVEHSRELDGSALRHGVPAIGCRRPTGRAAVGRSYAVACPYVSLVSPKNALLPTPEGVS